MAVPVLLTVFLLLITAAILRWRLSGILNSSISSRLPPIAGKRDLSVYSPLWGHMKFLGKVMEKPWGSAAVAFEKLVEMSGATIATVYPLPPWLGFPAMYVVRGEREAKLLAGKCDSAFYNTREAGRLIVGQQYAHNLKDPVKRKQQLIRLSSGLRRTNKLQTLVRKTSKHARLFCAKFLQPQDTHGHSTLVEDPGFLFNQLVTSAMAEFLGGVDVSSAAIPPSEKEKFLATNDSISQYFGRCVQSSITPVQRSFLFPLEYWKMRRDVRYMVDKWFLPVAEERCRMMRDGAEMPDDLLTAMLDENTAGSFGPAFDCKLSAAIANVFLETADSVTGALQWVFFYLCQSPQAQADCCQQISTLYDPDGADEISLEDLDAMPYVAASIKEAIRISSPTRILVRQTSEDFDVGDYTLPRGSIVIINAQLSQMSEANFESPEEFRPERWLDDPTTGGAKDGRATLSYAPFGFGASRCFGEIIAMTILKTSLAIILSSYKIEMESSAEEAYSYFPLFTFVPKKLVLRFVPHQAPSLLE